MNDTLVKERQALLALELTSLGVDVRRLGFLRWLRDNGHDPEWNGCRLASDEETSDDFSLAA